NAMSPPSYADEAAGSVRRAEAHVQLAQRAGELLAVRAEGNERVHQTPFALGREPEQPDTAVLRGGAPLDETGLLRALDELRDRGLLHLEHAREIRRPERRAGASPDHQEEVVALRRESRLGGHRLHAPDHVPERTTERRDAQQLGVDRAVGTL